MRRNRCVSVLIPTYRDAHLLRRSLPSYLALSPDEIEVLILNNDPVQDVHAAIGELAADPRVGIVEMGSSGNYSRAVNHGIHESSGHLVVYCNADVFPADDFLPQMVRFFAEHEGAGAAMGKLLRYDLATDERTDIIDSAGLELTRQRRIMARGEGEHDDGQFDEAAEVFAIDGAAIVARRRALEEISVEGEFLDENFVTHKEDHDVSWRLRLAGWECWYVPSAVAFHARTTRGLGAVKYTSAIRSFHKQQRKKSESVRIHTMKNQWLMLLKNEDGYNFARDFPFILGRETLVVLHNLVFSPRSLVAIPMTLRVCRETLRKRRAVKARQAVAARDLRRWLAPSA